jgi:hypothetical protein
MIRDVRATVQFDIFNVLNDDTLQTVLVFREQADINDDGVVEDGEFRETPVAFRRQGRQFQVALKLRF